jgi:3-oxoacyl-[acyl-carrier-protein] synthase II
VKAASRVVVTGLGAVSALGRDVDTQWRALLRGESGVTRVTVLPERLGGAPIPAPGVLAAGVADDLDPTEWGVPRKGRRGTNRHTHLAFAAAAQAVRSAGLTGAGVDPDAIGLMLGSPTVDFDMADLSMAAARCRDGTGGFDRDRFAHDGWQTIHPLVPLVLLNNASLLCQLAIRLGITGPSASFGSWGEAGGIAIGEAVRALRDGDARVVLAGGVSARLSVACLARVQPSGMLAGAVEPAPSTCRPWDVSRTGTVLGEAAALLVLETLEHARDRGARPLAEVLGCAATIGGGERAGYGPPQYAIEESLYRALDDAGRSATTLGAVYGDASGLPVDDATEAAALVEVLGAAAPAIPVTAVKGATGHTSAASMPITVVCAVLGLRDDAVPPTVNLRHPVRADLHLVRDRPHRPRSGTVACLAGGLGGQSTCLILSDGRDL